MYTVLLEFTWIWSVGLYIEYEPNELIHLSLYKSDINFTKTTTIYNKYIINQFYW